jgi:uncharacterized damage-inducible protein DinB
MNCEINSTIESWKLFRNLTYDLLESLPESMLKTTVGKNMGSIGNQFRHLGDVQICYNEAIKNCKMDFSKLSKDYSIENSKIKIRHFLEDIDKQTYKLIEIKNNVEIDWGYTRVSINEHLNFLIQHEILHHGELIVYIRSLDLRFPKSWEEIWGSLNIRE